MAAEKPYCQTGPKWIVQRLQDKQALAPLTGQDWRALTAFLHLLALYGNSDSDGRRAALSAMSDTVLAMQPSTRHFAKTAIPHVLDWGDEERLWREITQILTACRTGLSFAGVERDRYRALSEELLTTGHELRDELLDVCALFTQAAHDVRDLLNARGLACPSSIALAAELARAAIAKAEGRSS